ncbi:hypothetical protein KIPB_010033 [Kipferlia bialata]|uniref:Uncharacterized protein n=1 Tax=Kipferlia bialata TaxID=797122 RepID=A0A9K3GMJ3_9EUKA|nr:hypothetical protein KIPB_010033 [Kipferlia bialata]|eukprot:g10033.t1
MNASELDIDAIWTDLANKGLVDPRMRDRANRRWERRQRRKKSEERRKKKEGRKEEENNDVQPRPVIDRAPHSPNLRALGPTNLIPTRHSSLPQQNPPRKAEGLSAQEFKDAIDLLFPKK